MYQYPTNQTFTIAQLTVPRLLAHDIGRAFSLDDVLEKFVVPTSEENGIQLSDATLSNSVSYLVAFGVLEPEYIPGRKRPFRFIVRDPKAVRGNPAACTTAGLKTIIHDCLNELASRADVA